MSRRQEGYTLVELVVVIFIFSIVMTLISVSFKRIVTSSGQIVKSVETDIGGLIGLELLRYDLGLAGFGLPWTIGSATYSEAKSLPVAGSAGTDANSFNDSQNDLEYHDSLSHPPRAFAMLNDSGYNHSDYLVLKGTALSTSRSSRGWSYLGYGNNSTAVAKASKGDDELVPGGMDRTIVINTGVRNGVHFRDLVTNGSSFLLTYDVGEKIPKPFRPTKSDDRYLVYGISSPATAPDDIVTFPFNRVDYYLAPPTDRWRISSNCAPGTAVLYRRQLTQRGDFAPPTPVLDCVADLQVIFMLATSNDGTLVGSNDITVETLKALAGGTGAEPAETLRHLVKEVRVYVMAQQGRMDPHYSYPYRDRSSVIVVGDAAHGRVWSESALETTFGRDWSHYRWKVYTIAVQPGNLE